MLTKLMGKTILGAALAALTCTGPALASPAESNAGKELVQASVKHGDLDLTRQTDLARLKLRVERKARALCASSFDRDRISEETLACRAEVIASANAQIDRAVEVAVLRQAKARKG